MTVSQNYRRAETLLRVENVNLEIEGKPILRDISLKIDNVSKGDGAEIGQVVGLLGPSGCGKTSLFRILAGLNQPTSGSVALKDGKPVRRGQVGVVFQNYILFRHRTVRGNLKIAAEQNCSASGTVAIKVQQVLDMFGLAEHADKYPAQLSGGQRQRVAIAQQSLCSEDYLLMDEPFSGLDTLMTDRVCGLITEMTAANGLHTTIITTHDITAAIRVCDTIWLMGWEYRDGERLPGAKVVKEYDLLERGLAWQPDIALTPKFNEFAAEIREQFRSL